MAMNTHTTAGKGLTGFTQFPKVAYLFVVKQEMPLVGTLLQHHIPIIETCSTLSQRQVSTPDTGYLFFEPSSMQHHTGRSRYAAAKQQTREWSQCR
jgi:hypothetical protein